MTRMTERFFKEALDSVDETVAHLEAENGAELLKLLQREIYRDKFWSYWT